MKVVVISRGDYSDYHIVAICRPESVDEVVKRLPYNEGTYDKEEWEVDVLLQIPPGMYEWEVEMTMTGDIVKTYKDEPRGCEFRPVTLHKWPDEEWYCWSESKHKLEDGTIVHTIPVPAVYCRCHARDADHAIKITNEKRAQYIAEHMNV